MRHRCRSDGDGFSRRLGAATAAAVAAGGHGGAVRVRERDVLVLGLDAGFLVAGHRVVPSLLAEGGW